MQIYDFRPQSPECVQQLSTNAGIIPDRAASLSKEGRGELSVGLFCDDMPQNIVTRVYNYHLDYVLLTGDESPLMMENLKRTLIPDIAPAIKIVKTPSITDAEEVRKYIENLK